VATNLRVAAVVFDLDGVLVDSMPAIRSHWAGWAREVGVEPAVVLADLHLTAEELVAKYARHLDPVREARRIAADQALTETGIASFRGARALLDKLTPNAWAVVTSARRELALQHLALGGLPVPRTLVTAEDTARGKPDPAGYRLAARLLHVSPGNCLAVEDSPAGVRAARIAGMVVLGLTTSYPAANLRQAHYIAGSLVELRLSATRNDGGSKFRASIGSGST
jgi:mannitol-1-/sugar-/sorbitol-6-phosphatase